MSPLAPGVPYSADYGETFVTYILGKPGAQTQLELFPAQVGGFRAKPPVQDNSISYESGHAVVILYQRRDEKYVESGVANADTA